MMLILKKLKTTWSHALSNDSKTLNEAPDCEKKVVCDY